VELPGLAEKGDVSDYLDSHNAQELIAEIQKYPAWEQDSGTPFESVMEATAGTEGVEWVVRPWIAKGSFTLLTGKIKSAGKTTWALHSVRSVLDGKPFMGEPTIQTGVVYLTEQSGATLHEALHGAGLLERNENLRLLRWGRTLGTSWADVVAQAVAECERIGAGLLVTDTVSQFAGLVGDEENSAGKAMEAMRPLQLAAMKGIAVLGIGHERKSGGEVSDAGRGSSAFGGVADLLISLRRPEGNHPETQRKIEALSRFHETPTDLIIDFTIDGYVKLGDVDAISLAQATVAILRILPSEEAAAMTIDGVLELAGVKRTTAQRVLKQPPVKWVGKGVKGDPVRYWREG